MHLYVSPHTLSCQSGKSFGRQLMAQFRCGAVLSLLCALLLCTSLLVGSIPQARAATTKGAVAPAAAANFLQATNGFLTIQLDVRSQYKGQFTILTGSKHPQPNQTIFFPLVGTPPNSGTVDSTYITLKDVAAKTYWVNTLIATTSTSAGLGIGPGLNSAGYTVKSMNSSATVAALGSLGFRTTYNLPNFTVVQDVVIKGTTLKDSTVLHHVTVTNKIASAARDFGLRYLWDWEIAGTDASFFRTRNPNSAFTNNPLTFDAPKFPIYEEVDNLTKPTFSIFGTVQGGGLNPVPTLPDRVRYCRWEDAAHSAWDFADASTDLDSAVAYFWGFKTPITLGPGASQPFDEYVTTQISAIAFPTPTPKPTPTPRPTPTPLPTATPAPTATPVPTPTPPPITNASVAAGGAHSLLATPLGTVYAWGYNGAGQLGDGTLNNHATPVQVPLTNVRAVAAGWYHSLALTNDGRVFAWGLNQAGQLGIGSYVNSSSPVQVQIDNVIAIAAGVYHSVAIRGDGSVWCWGSNFYGQLGDGKQEPDSNIPVQAIRAGATAIAAGGAHTLAVVGGAVRAWGWNAYGQLGNGSGADSPTPITVPGVSGIVSVAAGYAHTLALGGGGVTAWGSNAYGQCGNGSTSRVALPHAVLGLPTNSSTHVISVSAGGGHSIALLSDGSLYAWGLNNFGQLGDGTNHSQSTPVTVHHGLGKSGNFVGVGVAPSAGYGHTIAIGDFGNGALLWDWGYNQFGQLGNNTSTNSSLPVPVLTTALVGPGVTPTPGGPTPGGPTPTPGGPTPTPGGVSGRIVFTSKRSGSLEIWTMNADGSNLRQLTTNQALGSQPSLSPDGTKIVFVSDLGLNPLGPEIFVMNVDGSGVTDLKQVGSTPSWSPVGKKIVFSATLTSTASEIAVMNANGTGRVDFTHAPTFVDGSPKFSPDGKQILFVSNRDGNNEIYTMNADGSNQVNLTKNAADDRDPSWFPNGSGIIFASNRGGTHFQIFTMGVNGQSPANLTNNSVNNIEPVFSSDGRGFFFVTDRDGNDEIYLFHLDTTRVDNLTKNPAMDVEPSFGPIATGALIGRASVGSSTPLSGGRANVITGSVSLAFLTALDSSAASNPANYVVTVNGQVVTVESVGSKGGNVTLALPDGALRAGDGVTVAWSGLVGAGGQLVPLGSWQGIAK